MIKLSILICTLPGVYRDPKNSIDLFNKLTLQASRKPVQILYLGDNKSMSVGEKRNKLMEISEGEYICFIDDDDQVTDNYVETMLSYCGLSQVVTIGVLYTQAGTNSKEYDYTYKKNINTRVAGKPIAGRVPDHLCLWRRDIAMRHAFPDANIGEDHRWADAQLRTGYEVEHRFDTIIYTYRFDYNTTQTRPK